MKPIRQKDSIIKSNSKTANEFWKAVYECRMTTTYTGGDEDNGRAFVIFMSKTSAQQVSLIGTPEDIIETLEGTIKNVKDAAAKLKHKKSIFEA